MTTADKAIRLVRLLLSLHKFSNLESLHWKNAVQSAQRSKLLGKLVSLSLSLSLSHLEAARDVHTCARASKVQTNCIHGETKAFAVARSRFSRCVVNHICASESLSAVASFPFLRAPRAQDLMRREVSALQRMCDYVPPFLCVSVVFSSWRGNF